MKGLLITILFSVFGLMGVSAQSFDALWKKVEDAQSKDLPQQVVAHSETIFKKASKEKNFPQLMKSWITILETKTSIDPDSFNLETLPKIKYNGPVQTAIYNAIMASAYLQMSNAGVNYNDEDTQTDYSAKAKELFSKVLTDKDALANESSDNYIPMVTQGKDSRLYNHDLLSLLTRFVMNHSEMTNKEKAEMLKVVSDYYYSKGKRNAWTLMTLDYYDCKQNVEDYNERKLFCYSDSLKALCESTKDIEAGVDVARTYMGCIKDADEKLKFARWARKQFSGLAAEQTNAFANTENQLMAPECRISTQNNPLAGHPQQITVSFKNLTSTHLDVRKYNGEDKILGKLNTNGKLILSRDYVLGDDSLCMARKAQNMPTEGEKRDYMTLPAGKYVLVMTCEGKEYASQLDITSLHVFALPLPDGKIMTYVSNLETGKPVANATLRYTNRKGDKETVSCDEKGEAVIEAKDVRCICAYIPGTDDETNDVYVYKSYSVGKDDETENCNLFTDRAIYRPGQTVHVTGFKYIQNGDTTKVAPNEKDVVTILDANYKELDKQEITTDEFGSFSVDFKLPSSCLPGSFTIQSEDGGYASVRVEEYKRPTFDVTADKVLTEGKEISLGDKVGVQVTAKTYSGVAVQGAKVHYTIETARTNFWGWRATWCDWENIAEGDTVTDDEGKSIVQVFLDKTKLQNETNDVLRYKVSFTVTDMAGETHEESYILSASNKGFGLLVKAGAVYDVADVTPIVILAKNSNDEDVDVKGKYQFCDCSKDSSPLYSGTFESGKAIVVPSLVAGTYILKAEATDKNGNDITIEKCISILDSRNAIHFKSKEMSQATNFNENFVYVKNYDNTFSETKPATLIFSPSEQDMFVHYFIMSNDKVVENGNLTIGKKLYKLPITYNKEYGKAVSILIFGVKNGNTYEVKKSFCYVEPDKELKLTWKTFRDKLYPGQKEEWTLNIKDKNGRNVNGAELFATMYDASLDALAYHEWNFRLGFSRPVRYYNAYGINNNRAVNVYSAKQYKSLTVASREFDEMIYASLSGGIRMFRGRSLGSSRIMYKTANAMMVGAAQPMMMAAVETDGAEAEIAVGAQQAKARTMDETTDREESDKDKTSAKSDNKKYTSTVRSNFGETAFFMPRLISDESGNVNISFTLPESLTEWKFLGFAHDKNVDYGSITSAIVAKKDFMVQPNMPRFVREGDKVSISSRIINQSDKDLEGVAQMRLIDPETDKIVLSREEKIFISGGKTNSVTFTFDVTDEYPMLICEITANSDKFSDGERNYLPVLSSKKYITETVPFYVKNGEGKNVDLSSLFNNGSQSATHKRLVFEYTANPSWTVVEALSGIRLPQQDCAPCFAASLYANTMASRIANNIPGFKEVIEQAQKRDNRNATNSPLAEDQDLKEIVLEECPWLSEALHESHQRAELIDLFNEDLMNQRTGNAKEKLQKLQNEDGSWSWFKGMDGSYYVTLSVCENLAMLNSDDEEVENMLLAGMKFLDKHELEWYNECKKKKYSLVPSESTNNYLYTWSLIPDRKVSSDVVKMRDVYLKIIEKNVRNLTIYGKANSACILRTFGHTKKANDFLESVVEYSITKPGMGRYYATDKAYYSWRDYKIPTQLAAMNAISQSSREDKESLLADMKLWLLRQKQTQMWDSPMNTISAVNYLMNELQSAGDSKVNRTFSIDGESIDTTPDSTRFLADKLGYVKTQIKDNIIEKGIRELTVSEGTNDGTSSISYGAVYAQYLEDMDKLQNQSSGELKVSQRILVNGKTYDANEQSLSIGDKVTIRLTISADRDMDFIQVRSQHPACFEPVSQVSGFRWMNGRGGYVALHDASTDIFFDRFTKGTTTYDMEFYVTRSGKYLTGIATAQCAYAPEFVAHSAAIKVRVEN